MDALTLSNGAASLKRQKDGICTFTPLDPGLLQEIALFHDLAFDQLALLSASLRHRRYPAATTIIRAGQPGEGMYVVLAGTVKVQVEQADGDNVILAILGAGQIVGEMSLADSLSCSATVVTLEESRLLWIDRARFQGYLQSIPGLQRNVIQLLSTRLRLANAQIQALATLDTASRVARQIMAFAQEYGQRVADSTLIPIRLTQDDLADLVGASRVHVNRVLTDYKRRGVLSVDQRHYITVHNIAELARRHM
jgi:CRP/FNR family transcriptional regulator, cyclic AMP receptor protein